MVSSVAVLIKYNNVHMLSELGNLTVVALTVAM